MITRSKSARECSGSFSTVAKSSAAHSERWAKKTLSVGAKRASSCRQLPRSDAGTISSPGLRASRDRPGLALEKKVDHLDGLAQAHVVGQASSQPELREEPEPANAVYLVRPQRGAKLAPGLAGIDLVGLAKSFEGLAKPFAGGHLRPVSGRSRGSVRLGGGEHRRAIACLRRS